MGAVLTKEKGGFELRLRYGKGQRGRFVITGCRTVVAAERRAALMTQLATELTSAGRWDKAKRVLERVAQVGDEAALSDIRGAVRRLCQGAYDHANGEAATPRRKTFREFALEWTSGALHEQHPDHVPLKKSADLDEGRLLQLCRTIGSVALCDFTLSDAERAMRALPKRVMTAATRRQYAQLVKKTLDYAVFPARIIDQSPIPRGWVPKVTDRKALNALRPGEDAQLLGCTDVNIHDRIYYGFLAREGLRADEAESMVVGDVDLELGALKLDKNKTTDPRAWALGPGVACALLRYLDLFRPGWSRESRLFVDEFGRPRQESHRADHLRAQLRAAGVNRPELYERSPVRLPVRVHDLRATFITISLANGMTETWVQDRTGHTTSIMLNRYRRASRTFAELGLGPLLPLDEAIPELAAGPGVGQRVGQKSRGPLAEQADAADLKSAARKGVPVRTREGLLAEIVLDAPRRGGASRGVWRRLLVKLLSILAGRRISSGL